MKFLRNQLSFLVVFVVVIHKVQAEHSKIFITDNDVDFAVRNITGYPNSECKTVQGINSDQHLDGERRHRLCELAFTVSGKEFVSPSNRKCFDPNEANLHLIRTNPCHLICFEKHLHTNPDECIDYDHKTQMFLLIGLPCGDDHVCNDKGCCVQKEHESEKIHTTIEPKTEEPETIEPTTLEPETIEPSTLEPETIEPTTLEPETIEPSTPEPETPTLPPSSLFKCERPGYFSDKMSNKTYHHCNLIVTVGSCGLDEIFSSGLKRCVYDQTTFDPSLEFYQWVDSIECIKPGIFRSPYNCRYFYACLPQSHGFFVYFGYCYGDTVFDEKSHTCLPKNSRCNNVLKINDDFSKGKNAGGLIYRLPYDHLEEESKDHKDKNDTNYQNIFELLESL